MYTIYTNGYKKGIEHSLFGEKPKGTMQPCHFAGLERITPESHSPDSYPEECLCLIYSFIDIYAKVGYFLKLPMITRTRKDGHVCYKNVPSLVCSSVRHLQPAAGENPAGVMAVEPASPAWAGRYSE